MTLKEMTTEHQTKVRKWLNDNPTVLHYMESVGISVDNMDIISKQTAFETQTSVPVEVIAADKDKHLLYVSMNNGVGITIGREGT